MKLIITALLLGCLTFTLSASVSTEDQATTANKQKVEFSEEARYLLKEATLRAISFLCFGEDVNQEIYDVICKKAVANSNSMRSTDMVSTWSSNCLDCDVADPICWDACPI